MIRELAAAVASYVPDNAVVQLHKLPRVVGPSEIPAAALFNPQEGPGMEYLQGLAAIVIGITVVTWLVLFLISTCSCCLCCRCCCCSKCGMFERGACRTVMLVILGLTTIALVGAGFAAAAPVGNVSTGYSNTLTAIGNVGGYVSDAAQSLGAVEASFNDMSTDVTALANAVQSSTEGGGSGPAIANELRTEVRPAIDDASSTMNGVKASLNQIADPIDKAVKELRQPQFTDSYSYAVPLAAAIVFGTAALLLLVTLIPLSVCRPLHCVSSTGVLSFGALLWLLTAAVIAAAVAVADVCVDPVTPLQGIARQADASELAPVIGYLGNCTGGEPLPGRLALISQSADAVGQINASFAPLSQRIRDNFAGDATVMARLGDVDTSVSAALGAVGRALDRFTCARLKPLWVDIADGFCNTMVGKGLIPYFGIQAAVGVLLVVVAFANLVACFRHPAQDVTPDEDAVDVHSPIAGSDAHVGNSTGADFGGPLVKSKPEITDDRAARYA